MYILLTVLLTCTFSPTTSTRYYQGVLLPRVSCSEIFVPLLTLLDNLLVVGAVQEEVDLTRLLALLDPQKFAESGSE